MFFSDVVKEEMAGLGNGRNEVLKDEAKAASLLDRAERQVVDRNGDFAGRRPWVERQGAVVLSCRQSWTRQAIRGAGLDGGGELCCLH